MKKIVDMVGIGAMVALVTVATLDLYVYDDAPDVQPVAYPGVVECRKDNMVINRENCGPQNDFQPYENDPARTFDISIEHTITPDETNP